MTVDSTVTAKPTKDINVKESDKGIPNSAFPVVMLQDYIRNPQANDTVVPDGTHIEGIASVLQRVECYHLLEKIEQIVAGRVMWKICHSGGTGPGNDRGKENTQEKSTLDSIDHEQNCKESIDVMHKCLDGKGIRDR